MSGKEKMKSSKMVLVWRLKYLLKCRYSNFWKMFEREFSKVNTCPHYIWDAHKMFKYRCQVGRWICRSKAEKSALG